jgi:adenylylsulfate kinase-like enzyme
VGVAVGVVSVVAGGGVAPVSAGSLGLAGGVVVVSVVPPSQAPKNPARLNINAKPKILIFINSSFTNCGNKKIRLLNTITYLLLIF